MNVNPNAYMTMFRADLINLKKYKKKNIVIVDEPRIILLMLEALEGHLTIKSHLLSERSIVLMC